MVRLAWGLREKADVKGHVSRHAIEEKLKRAEEKTAEKAEGRRF